MSNDTRINTPTQHPYHAHHDASVLSHSDIPPSSPPPEIDEVVPGPGAAGGLDNIPEALLSATEAAAEELDHAGLDVVLPDEDQAPAAATEGHQTKSPEKWGHI